MRKYGTRVLPDRKATRPQSKRCPDCCEEKHISEFYSRKEYANSHCRTCWRIRVREQQLLYKYGLSSEDYESLLVEQNFVCAICGCTESENEIDRKLSRPRRFAVDHCHTTGLVRGLLYSTCNKCLGMAKDNPDILRKAAMYLEERS